MHWLHGGCKMLLFSIEEDEEDNVDRVKVVVEFKLKRWPR